MSWKTDWLYALLLDMARQTWSEAVNAAKSRNELRPDYLVATEHTDYDRKFTLAFGKPCRVWTSTDDFTMVQDESVLPKAGDGIDPTRSIFRVPLFAFHIPADRKRVLISRHIGGRYGRGGWQTVAGQGKTGRLSTSGHGQWIA